jgi:hypothetical protein
MESYVSLIDEAFYWINVGCAALLLADSFVYMR